MHRTVCLLQIHRLKCISLRVYKLGHDIGIWSDLSHLFSCQCMHRLFHLRKRTFTQRFSQQVIPYALRVRKRASHFLRYSGDLDRQKVRWRSVHSAAWRHHARQTSVQSHDLCRFYLSLATEFPGNGYEKVVKNITKNNQQKTVVLRLFHHINKTWFTFESPAIGLFMFSY